MIEVCGVTRTDGAETLDCYERIVAVYGQDAARPMCGGKFHEGCGATTCYVVFPATNEAKERHWWLTLTMAQVYKLGGSFYVPIRICVRCGAAAEGYQCGLSEPARKQELLKKGMDGLAPDEHRGYREVFERAFQKGREKAVSTAGQSAKDRRKRYAITGPRGPQDE